MKKPKKPEPGRLQAWTYRKEEFEKHAEKQGRSASNLLALLIDHELDSAKEAENLSRP